MTNTEMARFKGWSEHQKDHGHGSIKFRLRDGYEHEHFFSEGESHQFKLNPGTVLADLREFYEATSGLRPEGEK